MAQFLCPLLPFASAYSVSVYCFDTPLPTAILYALFRTGVAGLYFV